ncbi:MULTISPECIES: hypothetical protein [unclassified Legionella]|uniref:hypothetical protein n=1 Tax=unclassified Legionella TaxID=2622702 RepID=UPI001054B09B|nr:MULTISPECIES: hypothetical protein [unclassified Legionella]MDI9819245.1 hypothetical protein [Legionella sp. PL877]
MFFKCAKRKNAGSTHSSKEEVIKQFCDNFFKSLRESTHKYNSIQQQEDLVSAHNLANEKNKFLFHEIAKLISEALPEANHELDSEVSSEYSVSSNQNLKIYKTSREIVKIYNDQEKERLSITIYEKTDKDILKLSSVYTLEKTYNSNNNIYSLEIHSLIYNHNNDTITSEKNSDSEISKISLKAYINLILNNALSKLQPDQLEDKLNELYYNFNIDRNQQNLQPGPSVRNSSCSMM